MNRHILRIFIFVSIVGLSVLGRAFPTHAGGSAWSWTDISDKVAERQNRPIWAIARAEPYWYFTDGQELYSGGHVWRTDGTYLADITLEVRNGGLTRVDDIVSDGSTVLFLKNITNRDSSVEGLSYNTQRGYQSLTTLLRSAAVNGGLAHITGNNGRWIIVTNTGRIVTIENNQASDLLYPTTYGSDLAYSLRHVSPADGYSYLPVIAEPLGNGWLVAFRDKNYGYTRFWKYDANRNATDVTSLFPRLTYIYAAASNGSTLILNSDTGTYSYDSLNVRTLTSSASVLPFSQWNRVRMAWDGTSWMILNDKNLARFDGTSFLTLGQTTDLILTLAGNQNGTFLVGGVESESWLGANPSYPLTANLLKVSEWQTVYTDPNYNGYPYPSYSLGGGRTVTSAYGPTMTTSGNPSNFRVGNGGTFIYHVTASDSNGVDHIDLYANGVRIKTCYSDVCEFSAQYFTNGLATRSIPFFAKAVDRAGYTTDGTNNIDTLTVDLFSTTTANNNSNNGTSDNVNGISSWTRTEPSQSTLRRDQSMTFYVTSWSAVGVKRVDIVVNGGTRQVCDYGKALGNQTCSVVLYGSDYPLNTQVAFNAKITDTNNKVTWTQLNTITIVDANGTMSGNGTQNTDLSSWVWSTPEVSSLKAGENAIFNVSAYDPQGVTRIEMWVNGVVQNSCSFSGTATNRECAATIYANNYKTNTDVFVNAKITDTTGSVGWSSSRTYHIGTTGNTNNGSTSIISVTSTPNRLTLLQGDVQTFTVSATDPDGVRRINIWLNGVNVSSCDSGSNTYSTKTCSTIINANSYAPNTNIFANAEIIDGQGNVTWSSSITYYVQSSTIASSATSADIPGWITVTSDKDKGFNPNDKITVTATAGDGNGISRIDILLNGSVSKACVNTSVCTYVAGPYPTRSSVSYAARVVDQKGYTVWTGYKTIYKK